MLQWIVFDADDTLMDFQLAQEKAFYSVLEKMGLEKKEAYLENYKYHSESLWRALERGEVTKPELLEQRFYRFCRDQGFPERHEELNETYIQELSKRGELIHGAREVLEELAKDYKLALATNGVSRIQKGRLEASGIGKYFNAILISEDTGYEKPHKGFFNAMIDKLGDVPLREILFIGDSLSSDMPGALDYGLLTCWYNPRGEKTNLGVHSIIKTLEEIPQCIKRFAD